MASDNIDTYGVVAGNVVDLNSGTNKIVGDLGSFNSVTGSGTVTVSGATNTGSSINSLLSNASYFYSELAAITPDTSTGASDIGGMTFSPGTNALTSSGVTIGGSTPQVTLDGEGIYIFQVPNGDLTTDPTSDRVFFNFVNGAVASNVYWVVSGNVNLQTIGNITSFAGTVLCLGNITLDTSSTSAGGLIAFSSSPDGTVTLNQNTAVCRNEQIILDTTDDNYINIKTTLADNQAIQINAADPNGGILITAGFGGIAVNTTNAISMNAAAASNLSTTLGNVALQSEPALVLLDGGAGIAIGCDNDLANTATAIVTPVINIGTSSSAKTIAIGNLTSTTEVTVNSGSGDIVLASNSGKVNIVGNNSAATAINLDASTGTNGITVLSGSGGVSVNSGTGKTQLVSNNTGVDAIRLDTSGSTGGIYITSASGGILSHSNAGKNGIYSTNTSVDAIRIDSMGSTGGVFIAAGSAGISIGNDGVTHPITIGNTIGTSSVTIQSGSFGIAIGNDTSVGQIIIGNSTVGKIVSLGNTASGSQLITRWQTAHIKHQEPPVTLNDAGHTATATELLKGLFVGPADNGGDLSTNRTITLDTASNIIGSFAAVDNDAFDFTIINTSGTANNYLVAMGTGGTMVGDNNIYPTTYNSTTFRLVVDVTNTQYTVYRLG